MHWTRDCASGLFDHHWPAPVMRAVRPQMLTDLSPEQRALADAMSEISESAYCAGWMDGLEYALWHLLTTGQTRYGRSRVTREELMRLRNLSERCGGWIVWDEQKEETFVQMEDWQRMFHDGFQRHRRFIEDHGDD